MLILAYFNKDVPRYGDSYVFKAYKMNLNAGKVEYIYPSDNRIVSEKNIESDCARARRYLWSKGPTRHPMKKGRG